MKKRWVAALLAVVLVLQGTSGVYASQTLPDEGSGNDCGAFFDEVDITQTELQEELAEAEETAADAGDFYEQTAEEVDITQTQSPTLEEGDHSEGLEEASSDPETDELLQCAIEEPEEDPDDEAAFRLSEAQIEEKDLLLSLSDETSSAQEDLDYVSDEILVEAEDEETALVYAEAFEGELQSYYEGLAVITVADAKEAVLASADPDSLLPPAWLNYIAKPLQAEESEAVESDAEAGDFY
ncbi:MAG: hypothetical protein J6113_02300, partial [Lachnospiraceae bacterium]|nr:hypothetical protein [Lachnospiraceae bacterium]